MGKEILHGLHEQSSHPVSLFPRKKSFSPSQWYEKEKKSRGEEWKSTTGVACTTAKTKGT